MNPAYLALLVLKASKAFLDRRVHRVSQGQQAVLVRKVSKVFQGHRVNLVCRVILARKAPLG